MTDTPQFEPSPPQRLGDILKEARDRQGLEISDIARSTHVRKDYLRALEEGSYRELPEDVYSKNFLRLYAQALGLDAAEMVRIYEREKPGAREPLQDAPVPAEARPKRVRPPRRVSRGFGGWFATLFLVVVLVAAAVWAFNAFMFNPERLAVSASSKDSSTAQAQDEDPPETLPASESARSAAVAGPQAGTVLLSVTSIPEGAEVSVDNYTLPGTTPVRDMPVTAGENRILRVSLPGYQTYEHPFDMTYDRNLSVSLSPERAELPATATADEAAAGTPAAQEGRITLNVEEASWLEVYAGTGRGQGQTLLYRTAQPGESFAFDLPVYLHVGNAGGVRYSLDGQDRGLLGSSGEVVSRAFE